ncbi:MAG: hypothetical protein QF696_09205 [Acidimicrobiales bacterium]|nr:hypothetical protein [Acidimicrobiales bacterium]
MLQHHCYGHEIILGNLASLLLRYCTHMARAGFCSAHASIHDEALGHVQDQMKLEKSLK